MKIIKDLLHSMQVLWPLVAVLVLSMAVLVLFMAVVSSAQAQQELKCGIHSSIVMGLDMEYQEKVIGRGLSSGKMLEVLASENGSWTILVVFVDGVACIWASGADWEVISSIIGDRV